MSESVMVNCPTCQNPVHTGMGQTRERFATMVTVGSMVDCPHCGRLITWSKEDAYLEGEDPPPRSGN